VKEKRERSAGAGKKLINAAFKKQLGLIYQENDNDKTRFNSTRGIFDFSGIVSRRAVLYFDSNGENAVRRK
jgi:hypothetical protein